MIWKYINFCMYRLQALCRKWRKKKKSFCGSYKLMCKISNFIWICIIVVTQNFGSSGKLFEKEKKDVHVVRMRCGRENMTENLKSRSSPNSGMPCIALSNASPRISMRIQHFFASFGVLRKTIYAMYLLFFSCCVRFHLFLRRTTRAKLC